MPGSSTPNPARAFKDAVYDQLARIGKATAAPKRLELLDLLSQGPRTVESLAEQAALTVANASQHLQVLRAANLVVGDKRGLHVEYRLADPEIAGYLRALRLLAGRRLAEVERLTRDFLAARDAPEPVDGAELARRVRAGEVTLVDVRPAEEYRAGHIAGALSIPLPELARRTAELPRRRAVVAYCRGPYCVMALDAVDLLRARGFRADRLEDSVIDWRARGGRVATGEAAA
jgi:rhodanese-related sulfurtransferase/DNA-binding transcriptional ArsR family regulator